MNATLTKSPAVEVHGMAKSFKDHQVLDGVEFSVPAGSIFALLGSNGAGKTTLVRILATLLPADSGSIKVCGNDVSKSPGKVRKSISLTGQFAAVDDVLTGRENLTLIARLRRVPDPTAAADALLERFGLAEASNRPAGTYSGGMRRRLDIAMSLIGSPDLILLDEPTTGLDPQARRETWESIRNLAAGGTTILLTTQYLDEAEALADWIAILHEGSIIHQGTLPQLQALLPPTATELITKKPTLEEIFLELISRAPRPERSES